jgi:hypothetical protein
MAATELDKDSCAWGVQSEPETRWAASSAVVAAAILYVTLPERYTVGPVLLLPVLEVALAIALSVAVPTRHARETMLIRSASLTLVALVSTANVASLVLLVYSLLHGVQPAGSELIFAAMQIWATNVIVFGLWYWELDRGGPGARCRTSHRQPDFLFPQMATPAAAPPNWAPKFLDYLYLAFTNATAFSPTDTLPLTAWSKSLMAVQALASLLTVALVAGRAVNIL